ncbi:hypothetical protein [Microbacterium sp. P03]|uniref:hypothetical protein n=1 Tax=Microbacterium sp. P03 TaxID=3366946 RepID=UPI00374547C2
MPADDGIEDELALLRRRAYAPDADITVDDAALARLAQLEEAVRVDRRARIAAETAAETAAEVVAAGAIPPRAAEVPPAEPDAAEPGPDAIAPETMRAAPRRRAWHTAAVITVAVVACALAATVGVARDRPVAAPTPSLVAVGPLDSDPSARTLLELPVDGAPVAYFDQGGRGDPPGFPIPEGLAWTMWFGEYYGRELWLARAQGGAPCVAAVHEDDVVSRCAVVEPFGPDGVNVIVAYADIAPDDRPEGMQPGQSIAYWWPSGGPLRIEMGTPGPDPG